MKKQTEKVAHLRRALEVYFALGGQYGEGDRLLPAQARPELLRCIASGRITPALIKYIISRDRMSPAPNTRDMVGVFFRWLL